MPVLRPFQLSLLPQFMGQYLIYFAPVVYLCFLVAESYQMDFRVFYVAGRSVGLGLDPYLNPVGLHPELFAAGNADYNVPSGFIYPPFAALVFVVLLGWIPSYEVARAVFSLGMLVCLGAVFYLLALRLEWRLSGEALLFALVSFPVLGLFERGQIDILLVLLALVALYLYDQPPLRWLAALVLAVAAHIKVLPAFLLIYFAVVRRDGRFCLLVLGGMGAIAAVGYLYFGPEVHWHFLQRTLPNQLGPIAGAPPPVLDPSQGVENIYVVRAQQGDYKIFSHDFVIGVMNPLALNAPLRSLLLGAAITLALAWVSRRRSPEAQYYQLLNGVNLFNPKLWIMGVVWYLPLFLYLYDRVGSRGRALLLMPLFLPPRLGLSAYAAVAVAFCFGLGWLAPGSEDPTPAKGCAGVPGEIPSGGILKR